MALPNITTKIINSDDYNERKILASDVNQIKQAIQTGVIDIKPSDIHMEGNVITADGGQNWIRRSSNKFQYYDAGTWKEITEATNTATFTAGENIAIRDVVYLKVSDGKIYKASNTNYDWIGVAKEAITNTSTGEVYLNNSVIGGFTGLTPGAWYGLSNTAGSITINKKEVGIAISSTQLIIIKNNTTELNNLYKLDSEKAINDVSATNSGVLAGSSQVLIDKFLDANGQNNMVDIGNTDSFYGGGIYISKYIGIVAETTVEDTSYTNWTKTSSGPDLYGVKIYSKYIQLLYQVKKASNCTATVCLLQDDSGNLLATANFSGNYATFNYILFANTTYQIGAYINGTANYTRTYNYVSISYPINGTNVNFTAPVGGSSDTIIFNIEGVLTSNLDNITYENSIIQSVSTTIPSGKTKVFVTPLMYEVLSTGDSITADVSIDNGSTYTKDVPINEWTPITSTNGTQLIVKANLNTADGSTSPKVSGWRVLLE